MKKLENYEKKLLIELIDNQGKLSEYVDFLYENKNEKDLNEMFGHLKNEGYINVFYADNRAYIVELTHKAKHMTNTDLKLSDKEQLLLLIGKSDEISSLFHLVDGKTMAFEEINDVSQYQMWIKEIVFYLQEIMDNTNDNYIKDTINVCNKRMNGVDDKKKFDEIVSRLKMIGKKIDKYYDNSTEMKGECVSMINKAPLVFISHSAKDVEYAKKIVDFLESMGIKSNQIFCSSVSGHGIELNANIIETLRDKFYESNLYVIFIHSKNYYLSAISLNEMGAAWILKTRYSSILLPEFEFEDMKGVVNSNKIAIKMDGDNMDIKNLLNQLYDDLAEFFGISRNTDINWERNRDNFIKEINAI